MGIRVALSGGGGQKLEGLALTGRLRQEGATAAPMDGFTASGQCQPRKLLSPPPPLNATQQTKVICSHLRPN
jgi:hypothetical protein